MKITEQDIREVLESEVGRFQPNRKVCKKCDYYDSVKHAGLVCTKCGGEFVNVSKWTYKNLLKRCSIHFRGGDLLKQDTSFTWFLVPLAYFLAEQNKIDWGEAYQYVCSHWAEIKPLYLKVSKE